MSTVKSSNENLTLNADGVGSDVIIQNNGTETVRVDSSGTVTATAFSGDGSSLTGIASDVVDDTTPQLGGDLDLNSNDITGTGSIDVNGIVTANTLVIDNGIADGGEVQFLSAGYNEWYQDNYNGDLRFFHTGIVYSTITSSGDFKFNSGYGIAATAYGVRAWVNFKGTSTVTIRASGNVSSVTDFGTGQYRANFTNAMPDANYGYTVMAGDAGTNRISFDAPYINLITTTNFRFRLYDSGNSEEDCDYVSFTAIR